MHLRPATVLDYTTFVTLFPELGEDTPPWDKAHFEAQMVATTLIAEDGGRAVGYAFFTFIGATTHVSNLVVAPDARRRGVGRALMKAVARRSLARCTTWRLNVYADNVAAIALYESLGLAPVFEAQTVRIGWSTIGAPTAPSVVAPSDDGRVEQAMRLLPGQLAASRARGRVAVLLEDDTKLLGIAAFDPHGSRAHPFRVASPEHAEPLLRAIRSHAAADDVTVDVHVEDQPDVVSSLIAAGGCVHRRVIHMQGALASVT